MARPKTVLRDRALLAILTRRKPELIRITWPRQNAKELSAECYEEIEGELTREFSEHGLIDGTEPNPYGLFVEDIIDNLNRERNTNDKSEWV